MLDPYFGDPGDEQPTWIPWVTPANLLPTFTSGNEKWINPYQVFSRTPEDAEKCALLHLGWELMDRGVKVDWLRMCHDKG